MALTHIAWWKWLPIFRWRVVAACEAADEIPDKLPRNGAVIVASGEVLKWVAFDCPCRTGHRIMLPLQGIPAWRLLQQRPLTITPSIDYKGTHRRCHYFLRAGVVDWA